MVSLTEWLHLTIFQGILLGMLLLSASLSLAHFLTFKVRSSGLRFLFNTCVIGAVLFMGAHQANTVEQHTYYLIVNLIALAAVMAYIELMRIELDLQLYAPTATRWIAGWWRFLPLCSAAALAADLWFSTYLMSLLIVIACLFMLTVLFRIVFRNDRLSVYMHLLLWGTCLLACGGLLAFGTRFLETLLRIDRDIAVHYVLLPAISLEFVSFSVGDMLRMHHARSLREQLQADLNSAEIAFRDQESANLAYRLNTHTLANVLNRIQYALLKHDVSVAMNLIHDYSTYLRSVLNLNESGMHGLEDEIGLLSRYLDLNKVQLGDAFTYHIENKARGNIPVPCMLLLPAVENAVIHGFSDGTIPKPAIHISFEENGGLLMATIADNGRGLPDKLNLENRFGLKNIQKRLDIISSRSGIDATFDLRNRKNVGNTETGACLRVGIPILSAQTTPIQPIPNESSHH